MSLLIVNAYAAAMIGRLRSLPLTFLGALMLGLLTGYLQGYLVVKNNQYFDSTFVAAVPVIVLFIVLLVLPSARLRAQGHRPHPRDHPDADDAWHVHLRGGRRRGRRARDPAAHPRQHGHHGAAVRHRHRRAVDGAAHRPRRPGVARAMELRRHRRDHDGPPRRRRHTDRPLLGVRRVRAVVGALIALPTLRLSGIYLALATAAFAVFLDRWIFGLRPFNLPFTDVKIAIFGTGSLSVARLELFGYTFDTEYRQLMLLATTFATASRSSSRGCAAARSDGGCSR